jgi:glucoamylase
MNPTRAYGSPGIEPRWTSSDKDGVGTAWNTRSRVWFTHSHGILNEIYYPRIDNACTRDFGLIVTDGKPGGFFSEEKRDTETTVERIAPGVPAFRLTNRCRKGTYEIEKELVAHPEHDAVLQRVSFRPRDRQDLRLFALVAPHLGNAGSGNSAIVSEYKGTPVLLGRRGHLALAVASSVGWGDRSAGYVGTSDGWRDLKENGRLTQTFQEAPEGNVALVGEIPLGADPLTFVLAIGFGDGQVGDLAGDAEACLHAVTGIFDDFDDAARQYVREWEDWLSQDRLQPEEGLLSTDAARDLHRLSLSTIRVHEEKRFPGGIIASLSIPWGDAQGDDDLGGYHVVWPRDLAASGGGLLAGGALGSAVDVLKYLRSVQESDGSWAQNLWLDGRSYWPSLQMDETAAPILLLELLRREGALDDAGAGTFYDMAREAAAFIASRGPCSPQDRWEEIPGYSIYTLATEIAALVAGAELVEEFSDGNASDGMRPAQYLLDLADDWFENLDRWTFATDSEFTKAFGIRGHYVRTAPRDAQDAPGVEGIVPPKNRPLDGDVRSRNVVSPDALALVRFGLRRPDDPRILDTVRVLDETLRVELPQGPCWYRFTDDAYGEHEDGSPFDGTGIGRPWPLLTAERALYELACGRRDEAERLLATFASCAGKGGLLPEQVWDADDLPESALFFGRPSHSAMPLVWAHAEYLKLVRSLQEGRVFDVPQSVLRRYSQPRAAAAAHWSFWHRRRSLPRGRILRILVDQAASIRWSLDEWSSRSDVETTDTTLGFHAADLPTDHAAPDSIVRFTIRWHEEDRWEGRDFALTVRDDSGDA